MVLRTPVDVVEESLKNNEVQCRCQSIESNQFTIARVVSGWGGRGPIVLCWQLWCELESLLAGNQCVTPRSQPWQRPGGQTPGPGQ